MYALKENSQDEYWEEKGDEHENWCNLCLKTNAFYPYMKTDVFYPYIKTDVFMYSLHQNWCIVPLHQNQCILSLHKSDAFYPYFTISPRLIGEISLMHNDMEHYLCPRKITLMVQINLTFPAVSEVVWKCCQPCRLSLSFCLSQI